MLAVVVDDHDMGVTHVIRGADHLNNAARQLQIIEAMGWPHPGLWPSAADQRPGRRQAVQAPRRTGGAKPIATWAICPRPCAIYLLRLGWSHGDDEIIPTAQAIEWFNLESIGKSAARMDYKKLDNLNGHYIRQTAR